MGSVLRATQLASLRNAKNTMAGMPLQGAFSCFCLLIIGIGSVKFLGFSLNFQTKAPSNSNDSQQGNLLQHLHDNREISPSTDVALTHGPSLFHICGTIRAEA
jgi:hypothetical protein